MRVVQKNTRTLGVWLALLNISDWSKTSTAGVSTDISTIFLIILFCGLKDTSTEEYMTVGSITKSSPYLAFILKTKSHRNWIC